jgi:hypothetical protein
MKRILTHAKRMLGVTLALSLVLTLIPPAFASVTPEDAADNLHTLGLFQGIGANPDGSRNFALDQVPTRHHAVTMLVRLIGKEAEALAGNWTTPFTDVASWARPYVGYAFENGLTQGVTPTTFGGEQPTTAAHYLTFVLRAMGYSSETDFAWNRAWELSDELGFTSGEFNAANNTAFLRGGVASISFNALGAKMKDTDTTLAQSLIQAGVFTQAAYDGVTLPPQPPGICFVDCYIDCPDCNGYVFTVDSDIEKFLDAPYMTDAFGIDFVNMNDKLASHLIKQLLYNMTVTKDDDNLIHVYINYPDLPPKMEYNIQIMFSNDGDGLNEMWFDTFNRSPLDPYHIPLNKNTHFTIDGLKDDPSEYILMILVRVTSSEEYFLSGTFIGSLAYSSIYYSRVDSATNDYGIFQMNR